jgi:hypothetical protein
VTGGASADPAVRDVWIAELDRTVILSPRRRISRFFVRLGVS